jgi:hypothetical protein
MGLFGKLFGPPDRDGFARMMMKELRARGGVGQVEYEPEEFRLRLTDSGGGCHHLFLGNAYNEYVGASRAVRREIVRRYASLDERARGDEGKDVDYAAARPMLLPRVRERFYHASLRLRMRIDGMDGDLSMARPFNDDLTVELVLDYPDAIRTISADTLQAWGVSFEEALAVAKDNLWKKSNENFEPLMPGLWRSPWADSHDASRLFLHELVWQQQVKGPHVAMVPNRDLLLVCGADDADALGAMATVADKMLQENRPMTGIAFRLEGSRWVPFLPPEGSPAREPLRQVAMRSRGMDYAEQNELLDALHQKTGEDVFVAAQRVMAREDGTWFSMTTWVDGVTNALMPEADLVTFGRHRSRAAGGKGESTVLGYADWERVRRVAGALMQPTDLYPVRYRVQKFPSEEMLAQMELRPTP